MESRDPGSPPSPRRRQPARRGAGGEERGRRGQSTPRDSKKEVKQGRRKRGKRSDADAASSPTADRPSNSPSPSPSPPPHLPVGPAAASVRGDSPSTPAAFSSVLKPKPKMRRDGRRTDLTWSRVPAQTTARQKAMQQAAAEREAAAAEAAVPEKEKDREKLAIEAKKWTKWQGEATSPTTPVKGKQPSKGRRGSSYAIDGRRRKGGEEILASPSPEELRVLNKLIPSPLPTRDLAGFAAHLAECKSVVVCIGAGASVAAGIPDFRTPGKGLYSSERLRDFNVPRPEDVFSLKYFRRRPDACYAMLNEMWPGRWPPTRVHYFLRLLHEKGMLTRVYTQNIDDLERLAGVPPSLLIEAHGTFSVVQCVDCGFSPSIPYMRSRLRRGIRPMCPECSKKEVRGPLINPIANLPTADHLFVYGTLRPDDTSKMERVGDLFRGMEYLPATLHGVRLYHDRKPVIRIPDAGASSADQVVGYVFRSLEGRERFEEMMKDVDMREGHPTLMKKDIVWVTPNDGSPPVAAYVYHQPSCARYTVVPYGDWERRKEWKALPTIRGLIKPKIVFFDEELPEQFAPPRIEDDLGSAEALIVIGTSLRVTPFCWLPSLVKTDCPRLLITLNARDVGEKAGFMFDWPGWRDVGHDGDCQAAVTELANSLGWGEELKALKAAGDAKITAFWKEQQKELEQMEYDDMSSDSDAVSQLAGEEMREMDIDDSSTSGEEEEDEEDEEEEEEEDDGSTPPPVSNTRKKLRLDGSCTPQKSGP